MTGTGSTLLVPGAAVLFDCDGVLVDSDPAVIASWSRWARSFDLDVAAVLDVIHGHRVVDTLRRLLPPEQREEGLARINAYETEDLERVSPIAGAERLLSSMPAAAWAVVTSGTAWLATARLRRCGLPEPAALVTADDVAHGKPAPDPYLAGAALVEHDPAETIVVEDSANGIAAARAAGAGRVIGIGRRSLPSSPDVAVPDLRALTWSAEGLVVDRTALLLPTS